jgi:dihydrofolate synthase / folylpolyglutamate synthase
MDYDEALRYIYSFTDYEKQTGYSYSEAVFDLRRPRALLALMGDPQLRFPALLVAGTKGKGSTSAMIASILRASGRRVGLYSQPHLHTFRERISIDGTLISPSQLAEAVASAAPAVEELRRSRPELGVPTSYEVATAAAMRFFAGQAPDLVVLEVGLGGRLDATNVVDPLVSVITAISLDHVQILGNTLAEIATEKAGIIKAGSIAVVGVQEPEVMDVLAERAQAVGAELRVEGAAFGVLAREVGVGGQQVSLRGLAGDYSDLFLPLFGAHQAHNAAVAIAAVEAFVGGGEQPLNGDVVRAGLEGVTTPGRLEIVRRSPTVLVDAAHNPAGVEALVEALGESFTFTRLIGVLAVLQDKDAEPMVAALAQVLDHVVVTRTTSPRAIRPDRLGQLCAEYFGEDRVSVVDALPEAVDVAAGMADDGGVGGAVLATGSVTTAAEVRMLLGVTST